MENQLLKPLLISVCMIGSAIAVIGCESPCGNPSRRALFAAENQALGEATYFTHASVSRVTCVRDCIMDARRRCKSVNFYGATNHCELNNATMGELPDNFGASKGSVYFDGDEDTVLLSLREDSDIFAAYQDTSTSPLSSTDGSLAPRSCKEQLEAGNSISDVYTIYPNGSSLPGLWVYCDQETDGGGWIVFQRRHNGSVNFNRTWDEYETGFGDVHGEFWLGNINLAQLTSQGRWGLLVDLGDWDGITAWAKYDDFKISPVNFTLHFGQYEERSTAGDSLWSGIEHRFTTRDNDQDEWGGNCAVAHEGGWWYGACTASNLNGVYYTNSSQNDYKGIKWFSWKPRSYSLKNCSMKIREIN